MCCEVERVQGLPRKASLSRATPSPIELVSGERRRARLKKLVTPKFQRISYDQLTFTDADAFDISRRAMLQKRWRLSRSVATLSRTAKSTAIERELVAERTRALLPEPSRCREEGESSSSS